MLDFFNIPNSQQDIKIFYANGSAWQTWQKPRKCNYVYIMCIGGGGGGAGVIYNGTLSGSTVNTAGTCGGGSGAVTKVLYNSQLINDVLYVQVGLGGNGGIPSSTTTSSFLVLRALEVLYLYNHQLLCKILFVVQELQVRGVGFIRNRWCW